MRILVFGGSGKIGRAVAWDLAQDPTVEEIALVGIDGAQLEAARVWTGSPKTTLHIASGEDRDATLRLMEGYDAGVLTLPDRHASYKFIEHAIAAGLSVVDVLEEYHRRPDHYEIEGLEVPPGVTLEEYGDWLHEGAVRQGVTIVDGMGLAPGLTNLVVGEGIRRLDSAHTAYARVGGIPTKASAARHPLRYMITWSFEHVLREYVVKLFVRKNGEIVEVEAGGDRESFRFDQFGHDEILESAVTPGMPSFIFTRPQLREFAEKTVRWPGHWQAIQELKECGLLSLDPVNIDGQTVVPRRFLSQLLAPKLQPAPEDRDVCVMYTTVIGEKDGKPTKVEHYMWEEGEPARGHSAMMRTTSYPAAIAVRMVAQRKINTPGIVAPEDAIYGELYQEFLAELAKRGVEIAEVVREA